MSQEVKQSHPSPRNPSKLAKNTIQTFFTHKCPHESGLEKQEKPKKSQKSPKTRKFPCSESDIMSQGVKQSYPGPTNPSRLPESTIQTTFTHKCPDESGLENQEKPKKSQKSP